MSYREGIEFEIMREQSNLGNSLTDAQIDTLVDTRLEEINKEEKAKFVSYWLKLVPKRFVSSTFENFEIIDQSVLPIIDHLKTGKSTILSGSNGSGKTHLAYASCLHQAKQGIRVMFLLAFDFFSEVKESFNGGNPSEIVNKYAEYDYLVIDEADKAFGSQNEFIYLYSLINKRYDSMKSTVLISNSDPATLMGVVGKSTFDRIASEGKVIEMKFKNYRQKGR